MRYSLAAITAILAIIMFTACDAETGKPASSNRPYEVLVVGENTQPVIAELTDSVSGLPQREPCFDVKTTTNSNLNQFQKLARSIIIVRRNDKATDDSISYKMNVYAKPQIIITITLKGHESLSKFMKPHKGLVRRMLEKFEYYAQAATLKRQHNTKAEGEIRRMFGIDMLIPADMTASKKGKDFLWLSNNTNEGLQNICVYRVKTHNRNIRDVRDSIMMKNIPGDGPGMFMETAKIWNEKTLTWGQNPPEGVNFYRGLWDIRGDAMGGPFIVLEIRQKTHIIYVEGFVYAPEGKKRNKMRRLEASVFSAITVKQ